MGKGTRKLPTSRSERLLGYSSSSITANGGVTDVSEFVEEDIWSLVDNLTEQNDQGINNYQREWNPRADAESNENSLINRHPMNGRHVGGLSFAFEGTMTRTKTGPRIMHQHRGNDGVTVTSAPRQMATSAPVNVPDWSKILRVGSVESMRDSDEGVEDYDDSEMLPPHEYLAREYARHRRTGGASVFEGVGRTLKGRDMSRVRDAVWSQTGFDG